MSVLKAVIGANYGDEGKGLATDYLCQEALKNHKSCVVICTNGGAQRGHTVETDDGKRFVFHHLGSGSLLGVGSYFCADYILNPILFQNDWLAFLELCDTDPDLTLPRLSADPGCRFSTPFDMMTNQILEDARGRERHGSVGAGIWETVRRYEKGQGISIAEMLSLTPDQQFTHIKEIRNYFQERIQKKTGKGPTDLAAWKEIWTSDTFIWNYLEDLGKMCGLMAFAPVQSLAKYDILIAENAQGVLLGQIRFDGTNFTTPSDTGALEIRRLLETGMDAFVTATELYYVTRSYLTKHGAGIFKEECAKEDLSPLMERDLTNVPNDYQGTIRYGHLNPANLFLQLEEDCQDMGTYPYDVNLLITHTNELAADHILEVAGRQPVIAGHPLTIYIADERTRTNVKPY